MHKHWLEPGIFGAFKVATTVAHEPRFGAVDAEKLTSLINETRCGLAAVAFDFEFGSLALEAAVGMVRTVEDAIHEGAVFGEEVFQTAVDGFNIFEVGFPSRDNRLVGDDDGRKAGAVERADGSANTGKEFEIVRSGEVTLLDVERSVAVEKHSRAGHAAGLAPDRSVLQITLDLGETFRRSHVFDVTVAAVGEDALTFLQPARDRMLGDVDDAIEPLAGEEVAAHDVECGIDQIAVFGPGRMRIGTHRGDTPVTVDLDEIGVVRVVIGMGKEADVGLFRRVEVEHPTKVEIDERVAIEDEKFLVEVRQRIDQSARRAARGCFLDAANADTELASVAEIIAHNVGTMVHQQQNVSDALLLEQEHGALEQGLSEHRRHRLRDIHPKRLGQARAFTTGKNDSLHQGFSATISDTANLTASGEVICAPQPSLRSFAVE